MSKEKELLFLFVVWLLVLTVLVGLIIGGRQQEPDPQLQTIEDRLDKLEAEPEIVKLPEFFPWNEEPECGQWSVKSNKENNDDY